MCIFIRTIRAIIINIFNLISSIGLVVMQIDLLDANERLQRRARLDGKEAERPRETRPSCACRMWELIKIMNAISQVQALLQCHMCLCGLGNLIG